MFGYTIAIVGARERTQNNIDILFEYEVKKKKKKHVRNNFVVSARWIFRRMTLYTSIGFSREK